MIASHFRRYPPDFAALRETPLHTLWGAAWEMYYPSMAQWLNHERTDVRAGAVERLMMAVFRAEFGGRPNGARQTDVVTQRLSWLFAEIERANAVHPDIIPIFLNGLRYHGDDEPYRDLLIMWLDRLAGNQTEGVDAGLIKGTRLMVARDSTAIRADMAHHLKLLDDPSDYVRGCAAYLLGSAGDEDSEPDIDTLFGIIGAKERQRPGIAGPFWTARQYDIADAEWQRVTLWMLDLLEQRKGAAPLPPIMPFNDIEFYLHELCSHSPELMWRMLRGGHTALALMTATEVREPIEGVQQVLEALASDADPDIAIRAKNHLAAHYSKS